MNVYDTANKLAEEIKTSDEYIKFKNARQIINDNSEYKAKIKEFEKIRYEVQLNTIQNGMQNQSQVEQLQNLYKELIEIDEVKNYFDVELKFNIMLGDVNKIISDAVQDVIS